ncbi:uncharacterized protein EV422DRAFT_505993 [Fimicolochytrium jonesii]|uniref:uncharacterized protein n=1 Tax=Fimicolochytrium jonesii TaxID=1396493 RepID=UPI0022FEE230|nr:uncharacterized protein EV422DRAFT_505993 [Fimicolochytrium jonesii]KAI8821285.1 hypothetical protein EV422DRAFT_505993 [Fimicolochytrium jonesii]
MSTITPTPQPHLASEKPLVHSPEPHHYEHTKSDAAYVLAPRHPHLAAIIAAFTTVFIGPFAYLLLCFWYNRYTRAPVLLSMGSVLLLQSVVTLIAGIVIHNDCLDRTRTTGKSACEVGYGYYDHTAPTLQFECVTDCSTIIKALGGGAAVFLACGIVSLVGGGVGMWKLRQARKAPPQLSA